MKSTLRGILAFLISVFYLASVVPSNASPAIQKIRDKISAESLIKTKNIPKHIDAKLRIACQAVYIDVYQIDKEHRCSKNCDNTITKQTAGLYKAFDDLKSNWKKTIKNDIQKSLPLSSILSICLRLAVADQKSKASYGVAQMMIRAKGANGKLMGGLWAFTSFALGKGVAKSRMGANAVLLAVSNSKETDKKTKRLLLGLGILLIKSK